jgi:hypothetical protein
LFSIQKQFRRCAVKRLQPEASAFTRDFRQPTKQVFAVGSTTDIIQRYCVVFFDDRIIGKFFDGDFVCVLKKL